MFDLSYYNFYAVSTQIAYLIECEIRSNAKIVCAKGYACVKSSIVIEVKK